MKALMNAQEVVELVLATERVSTDSVNESLILAAQHRYIKPVINSVYNSLLEGRHVSFNRIYLKPALAMYVKYMLMSSSGAIMSDAGLLRARSNYFDVAAKTAASEKRKQIRMEADALIQRAVAYIEANATSFPEYLPEKNVMHRVSIKGGVVL